MITYIYIFRKQGGALGGGSVYASVSEKEISKRKADGPTSKEGTPACPQGAHGRPNVDLEWILGWKFHAPPRSTKNMQSLPPGRPRARFGWFLDEILMIIFDVFSGTPETSYFGTSMRRELGFHHRRPRVFASKIHQQIDVSPRHPPGVHFWWICVDLGWKSALLPPPLEPAPAQKRAQFF